MEKLPLLTGDYARQYIAAAAALLGAAVLLAPFLIETAATLQDLSGGAFAGEYFTAVGPRSYLVFWVLFAVGYCTLTHKAFTQFDSTRLHQVCAAQHKAASRWWHSLLGSNSAESWTFSSAIVSAVLTILITTTGLLQESIVMILLGFGTVAGSWAIMAYSFALRYARIRASGQQMDFPVEDAPLFGDFLTHSVFVSTLIGGHATLHTREAWVAQRSHVLLAFAFNTVIVAMSVTLLFGGFTL